ncbi:MAG: ATP phosphoribosyltransferase [Nitrospirae bacterium]|nr:MAG: ATP phosphoribosyltransferase [Nitrospirota bacterium]
MIGIALPKGRLLEESLEFFSSIGIDFDSTITRSRRLIHYSSDGNFKLLVIRAKDVPTFVQYGGCDMGIVGRDVLMEASADLYEVLDLGFGYCRLCVAVPEDIDEDIYSRPIIKVATKYPSITERFFAQRGQQVEIITLYGSIELAPVTGMSDAIVDLVSTGKTLRANRLKEIETVFESTAWLVVNRHSFKQKNQEIVNLIKKIKEGIHGPGKD